MAAAAVLMRAERFKINVWMRALGGTLMLLVAACAGPQKDQQTYHPIGFDGLPGWVENDPSGSIAALKIGCQKDRRIAAGKGFGADGLVGDFSHWRAICAAIPSVTDDALAARQFYEQFFTPYQLTADGRSDGLFTGYYEPRISIRAIPDARHTAPLFARPTDLVMADLGRWAKDLKGRRIAGRQVGARLLPYHSRTEIGQGALAKKAETLAWADPIDAFFLHIQGSGVGRFADGREIRLAYDGHNGHPYHAIGRTLIARGEIARAEMSMQAIDAWLRANPEQAASVMGANASFIFFRANQGPGPTGAAGVPLTAGYSLAVDTRFIPFETPVWLTLTNVPPDSAPLNRLLIAQDRGGAIKGAVRGDVFWGGDDDAALRAGKMAATGQAYVLLPKTLRLPRQQD
jgi:membrane-bound lytic murein transglycosylase A